MTPPDIPQRLETEVCEIHHKPLPLHKLCNECMEANLLQEGVVETFRDCPTCGESFCPHAVSHLDPKYCIFCCNDFQFTSTDETITREVKDEDGSITSKKSFRVRHMTLGGDHYLLYNRAITVMSNVELECGIEYHRGILNGMIREREDRRIAYAHRNKGKTAGNENAPILDMDANGAARFTLSSAPLKRTRTLKVKAVADSEEKKKAKAALLIQQLIDRGMTPERFAQLMRK